MANADAPAPATTAPKASADAAALKLPPGVRIATGKPARLSKTDPASTAMDKLVDMLPVAEANAGEREPRPARRTAAAQDREWRFDMLRDGKAMSADEFDAWMKARGVRVAGRKPAAAAPAAGATAPATTTTTPAAEPAKKP